MQGAAAPCNPGTELPDAHLAAKITTRNQGQVAERLNAPVSKTEARKRQAPERQALATTGAAALSHACHGDGDLAAVVERWPDLPDTVRRAIVTLVGAEDRGGGP